MGDRRRCGGPAANLPPLLGAADAQTARQPDPLRWVRAEPSVDRRLTADSARTLGSPSASLLIPAAASARTPRREMLW